MQDTVIEVQDIQKKFKVYFDKGQSLKEKLLFQNRNRYEERWVLKGLSFSVARGEAVGLIGHNGCGKSTLLKLLTRIIYPDSGNVSIRGRVSSLLELGAGFHPDMSGRENIYTNAAIFGLTKKEIDARLEQIIAFSELEEFIDNPVRTYSSGMYMRLAFSVAIHVDADVLLIDEILAVGDAAFQAKCFERLCEIKATGTTIVIVSHSLSQIERFCDRSIWLDQGLIRMEGAPCEVHPAYLEFMGQRRRKPAEQKQASQPAPEQQEKPARLCGVSLLNANGEAAERFKTGEPATLCIQYQTKPDQVDHPMLGIALYRNDKLLCYGTNTQREHFSEIPVRETGTARFEIEKLNLVPGTYWFDIGLRAQDLCLYDYRSKAVSFVVYSAVDEIGVVRLDHTWKFE